MLQPESLFRRRVCALIETIQGAPVSLDTIAKGFSFGPALRFVYRYDEWKAALDSAMQAVLSADSDERDTVTREWAARRKEKEDEPTSL